MIASGAIAKWAIGKAPVVSGASGVTGDASITEAAETLAASGSIAISGSASITEAAETLSASGTVTSGVVGTASITEDPETLSASGVIAITGTADLYELAETLTASGISLGDITGSADLTQAAQTLSAFATSAFSTIARPDSDASNTGWAASTGSDLYAMIDEVTPDDADYIYTNTVGAVCSFSTNTTQYPGTSSQQLSLRASSSTGNGLTVVIKDGATTIATRTLTLTPTFDLHTITLTNGEIAAITSGSLTIEMTST